MQGNYHKGGVFWIVYSISFWLLFSYMIPISLFVTMEIVKAFQVRGNELDAGYNGSSIEHIASYMLCGVHGRSWPTKWAQRGSPGSFAPGHVVQSRYTLESLQQMAWVFCKICSASGCK